MSVDRRKFLKLAGYGSCAAFAAVFLSDIMPVSASEPQPGEFGETDVNSEDPNYILDILNFAPYLAAIRAVPASPNEIRKICGHINEPKPDDGGLSHVDRFGGHENFLKILNFLTQGKFKFKLFTDAASTILTFTYHGKAVVLIWGTDNPTMFSSNPNSLKNRIAGYREVKSPGELENARKTVEEIERSYRKYCEENGIPVSEPQALPVPEKRQDLFVPALAAGALATGLAAFFAIRSRGTRASGFAGAGD